MEARQQVVVQNTNAEVVAPMILKIIGPNIKRNITVYAHKKYTIGRDEICDIHLDDERVSRHHASLFVENGQWILRDLKSVNQIFTAQGLVSELLVEPGANFQIGPVQFTTHNEGELFASLGDISEKVPGGPRRIILLSTALVAVIFSIILVTGNKNDNGLNQSEELVIQNSKPIETNKSHINQSVSSLPVDSVAAKKSKEHYYLAIQNYDTRNLENAITELEHALRENPNNVPAKKKMAEIQRELDAGITRHFQQGCFHAKFLRRYEAEQEFQTVIQMTNNKTDGRYLEAKRMLALLNANDGVSLRCGVSEGLK